MFQHGFRFTNLIVAAGYHLNMPYPVRWVLSGVLWLLAKLGF